MHIGRRLVFALFAVAAACGPTIHTDGSREDRATAAVAALGGAEERASAVYVLGSGSYPGRYVYHGAAYQSFWVDLSVRNDASQKDVGIVWTADGWRTSQTARATYEGPLADGRERWGLDVVDAVLQAGWMAPSEIEFAAFATMNGTTSWSPFRNHYIFHGVSSAEPIRVLTSKATLDGANRPTVSGVVRALRTQAARRVFVRWSVDNWRTHAEVEAKVGTDSDDFTFAIPVAGDWSAIDELLFAVRLEAGGETAWDNNHGDDHHVRLAPRLDNAGFANAPLFSSSGIKNLGGNVSTALPVRAITLMLDDGTTIPLPELSASGGATERDGFSSNGNFFAALSTARLSDGRHTVAIEAAAGPFVRRFAGPGVDVDGNLVALGTTLAVSVESGEAAWDFLRLPSGDTLVLTDRRVLRYAAGASTPTALEGSPVPLGVGTVAVDGSGRVYALAQSRVVRWTAAGQLDRGFGASAILELLNGSYDGTALCDAADFDVDARGMYVVDSCNARLLRFTLDGTFVDSLSLATNGYTFAQHVYRTGDSLWVARSFYVDGQATTQLAAIATAPGAATHRRRTDGVDAGRPLRHHRRGHLGGPRTTIFPCLTEMARASRRGRAAGGRCSSRSRARTASPSASRSARTAASTSSAPNRAASSASAAARGVSGPARSRPGDGRE